MIPIDPTEELSPASRAMRTLVIVGDGETRTCPLPAAGDVSVGRGDTCAIQLHHKSVSREHAMVRLGTIVAVEDLGSVNGTAIGGRRLQTNERAVVPSGGVIEVGAVLLIVRTIAVGLAAGDVPPSVDAQAHSVREVAGGDPMTQVLRVADAVAQSGMSILLLGETGSGKEVLAERIHRASSRANKPFIGVSCAALADNLLESELFGHERGAFTGAVQAKVGLLEAADGGTVFLDELGEMPLTTQAKLLRALEKREVLRVGAVKPRPFDARFVAATHRDLDDLVDKGLFRSDLFFRLNGISIRIPPLRERKGEICTLARVFAAEFAAKLGRATPAFDDGALAHLEGHGWPGNIRELRNVIERAVVLAPKATLSAKDIPLDTPKRSAVTATPSATGDLPEAVAALERQRIVDALAQVQGNQTKAAKLLGISRRMLIYRLGTYNIGRPRTPE